MGDGRTGTPPSRHEQLAGPGRTRTLAAIRAALIPYLPGWLRPRSDRPSPNRVAGPASADGAGFQPGRAQPDRAQPDRITTAIGGFDVVRGGPGGSEDRLRPEA